MAETRKTPATGTIYPMGEFNNLFEDTPPLGMTTMRVGDGFSPDDPYFILTLDDDGRIRIDGIRDIGAAIERTLRSEATVMSPAVLNDASAVIHASGEPIGVPDGEPGEEAWAKAVEQVELHRALTPVGGSGWQCQCGEEFEGESPEGAREMGVRHMLRHVLAVLR